MAISEYISISIFRGSCLSMLESDMAMGKKIIYVFRAADLVMYAAGIHGC